MQSGLAIDCRDQFGPRPRSDEHIIPTNVFGRVITTDLCKCCNEFFGALTDHSLAHDQQIVLAAKRAGMKETDLWPSFEGTQRTPKGRNIRIAYSKGTFQPKPSFQSLDELTVPIIHGRLSEEHLKHFTARLVEKVRRKGTHLSLNEVRERVESLVAHMRQDPTKPYTDPIIAETVAPTQMGTQVTYTRQTKPWETHWCLAKIIYELSHLLWPANYRKYFAPDLAEWRDFLERREVSADGTQTRGIFIYDELPPELASRQHTIEGLVSATEMKWSLVFFGTARWSLGNRVMPRRPPPEPGRLIRITNPFGSSAPDAEVSVTTLTT